LPPALYIVWRETRKKYVPTATVDLDGSGTEQPTEKDKADKKDDFVI
jgi:hypothetical protein